MGVVFKQGVWGSVMMYLGVLLGYLNVAILFPTYFSAEELGLRSIILDFCSVVGTLSLLGSNGALLKFLPQFKDKQQRSRFFLLIGIMVLVGVTLFSTLVFLFDDVLKGFYREKSPLFLSYFYLIGPWIGLIMLNLLWESIMIYNLKITYASFVRDVYIRLATTALILCFAFSLISISLFWKLYLLVYFSSFLILLIISLLKKYLNVSFNINAFKLLPVKQIVEYSLLISLTSAVSVFIIKLDVLMLGALSIGGLTDVGIYVIGVFIISLIEIPKKAIHQVSVPLVSRAFQENDMNQVATLYKKTSINQIIIGSMLFGLIWLSIDYIYDIIPKTEIYHEGKIVVLIIGFAKLLEMAFSINGSILVVSEKYRQNFIVIITTLVISGVFNYFFIPIWGIAGAAVATLLTYTIMNLLRSFLVYYYFKMQPFQFNSLLTLIVALGCYFVVNLLPVLANPFFGVIMNSIVFLALFGGLIYILKLSKEIDGFVAKLIHKYIKGE